MFDANIPYDLRYFQSLHRIMQIEPWLERDKAMIHHLKTIGIERDKPFKPNPRTKEILLAAISEAHDVMEEQYLNQGNLYYSGKQWKDIADPFAIKSGLTFESPEAYAH